MYRIILLSVVVLMVMGTPEEKEQCQPHTHEILICCNKEKTVDVPKLREFLSECNETPMNPKTCDLELCLAKNMGYITSNGTFIKTKYAEDLDKYAKDTKMVDLIKLNCLERDISKYGNEYDDACIFKKIQICSAVQYVKTCPSWKDEDDCKGVETTAKNCIKRFE